jgi:glycine cleavage system H protein
MVPEDLLYTDKHEWVKVEGDTATIGITDYAQTQLGDIVYLELPTSGTKVARMSPFGTIEAVKAVSDLYAPVSGEVVQVNDAVSTDPAVIKSSPYGDGWMVKIKLDNSGELSSLLKADKYRELIGEQ